MSALAVYRFVKTSVKTSVPLCLPVMAQGQEGWTRYFNSRKVCLNRSKCKCVCVIACVYSSVRQEKKRERGMKKGKEKVETSVEGSPGQKVEAQSTKMTTLEYESKASGTLGT